MLSSEAVQHECACAAAILDMINILFIITDLYKKLLQNGANRRQAWW